MGIQFTFPEWESVYKLYINENAGESKISFNDFLEKIKNGIIDLNSKDIIDYDKDKILSKKVSIKTTNDRLQNVVSTEQIYDRAEILSQLNSEIFLFEKDLC